jgi:hypothetical protein
MKNSRFNVFVSLLTAIYAVVVCSWALCVLASYVFRLTYVSNLLIKAAFYSEFVTYTTIIFFGYMLVTVIDVFVTTVITLWKDL